MDATSLSLSIPHRNRVTNVQPQTGTPQRTLGTPLASRSNLSFKLFTVSAGLSCRFLIGKGRKYHRGTGALQLDTCRERGGEGGD